MEKSSSPWKLVAVVIVLCVVAAAGLWWLKIHDFSARLAIDDGLAVLRGAGPLAFFSAMAVLPACGVPMLVFSLPALSLFAARLGTTTIILLALGSLTANILLTYALARRGLRPLLAQLVTRLGYKLPQVEAGDATDLVILLRVTPGIPFFAQNYLLGLAGVPLGKYLLVSCIITWPLNTAFMLFGQALLEGRGKLALLALCALLALTAATHLVRRHYERRKKSP